MWRLTLLCRCTAAAAAAAASSPWCAMASDTPSPLSEAVTCVRTFGVLCDERQSTHNNCAALWQLRSADPLRPCDDGLADMDVHDDMCSSSNNNSAAATTTTTTATGAPTTSSSSWLPQLHALTRKQRGLCAEAQTMASGSRVTALTSSMVNIAHIEGTVVDVQLGYAVPPSTTTQTGSNNSNSSSSSSSRTSAHSERECSNVVVVDVARAHELMLQVWLHVRDMDDDDSNNSNSSSKALRCTAAAASAAAVPLCVCCYVSLATVRNNVRSSMHSSSDSHGKDAATATMTDEAVLDTYARALSAALLQRRVVFTGQLRSQLRHDVAVSRVVCVPVLWLPPDGLQTGHHVLPA